MKWLKVMIIILTIIVFSLVQASFFTGSQTFFIVLNPLWLTVIWLCFINSRWVWWFVILGGFFLDLQQGLMGVNLLTLLLLTYFISFLRKRIAITGRFTQFFFLSLISLLVGIIFQLILIWFKIIVTLDWPTGEEANLGVLVNFNCVAQALGVNLFALLIFYPFLRKRSAL